MSCKCEAEANSVEQAKTLKILLLINLAMFFFEILAGILAHSMGLIADSLDMFADATVYGVSLYAVKRSIIHKANAACLSGIFQCLLGFGVLLEVVRRFFLGSEPVSILMISVGLIALIANIICLVLLSKHRKAEVHMRASWIFSTNDVLANLGVILAGILVAYFGSKVPDLIIGSIISSLVTYGGFRIIKDARRVLADNVHNREEHWIKSHHS